MNAETLSKCLSLGWSSRYNDREGIGRFGVGMKLGAIHQCKRVEVWSKQSGAGWLYTYIDLDEIEQGTMGLIPFPVAQEPPQEFASLAGSEQGTLVVWSKYDNLRMRLLELLAEIKPWAGRTFRYFIWNEGPQGELSTPLTITINNEVIPALDPLTTERKTKSLETLNQTRTMTWFFLGLWTDMPSRPVIRSRI